MAEPSAEGLPLKKPGRLSGRSGKGGRALAALLAVFLSAVFSIVSAEALQLAVRSGFASVPKGLSGICAEAWAFDFASALVVSLLGWAVTNRVSAGCLSAVALSWILAFASALKYRAVGKPLVMSDFALVGDVMGVAGGVVSANVPSFVALAMVVLVALVCFVAILRRPPAFPLTPVGRYTLAVVLCLQLAFGMELSSRTGTTGMFFRGDDVNGFLMNFLRSSRHAFRIPEGYGREAVERVLSRAVGRDADGIRREARCAPCPSPSCPDVLVYVGESFFDTNRLEKVTFDRDPTPNFHRIVATPGVFSGRLTSPERGGTTANVEFELMTGIPMAVFPESDVPYHGEIFRDVQALPSLFARSGVETPLAVHNSYKDMFSYGTVYPHLGFGEFIDLSRLSTESFSGSGAVRYDPQAGKDVLFEGLHPSDEPLAIALADALSQGGGRKFAFGLSIVSHGGFSSWPEDRKTVRISSGGLPADSKEGLEHMANALERADRALGHVVDAVMASQRPTVMFFMGDHLPYVERRFLEDGGFDFGKGDVRSFDVPYFALANFPLADPGIPDGMSVFFAPAKVRRMAGCAAPDPYLDYLETVSSEVVALSRGKVAFPDGREFAGLSDPELPPADADRLRNLLAEFSLVAWDRLHGEAFSVPVATADGGGREGGSAGREAAGSVPQVQTGAH